MAILNSCCCWKSVRRGSFAVAVYSVLYYSVLAWFLWPAGDTSGSVILQEEEKGEDAITHLSRPMFILSITGLLTCFLLLLGLCKDKAWLLLPWIIVQVSVVVGDVVAAVYLVWVQELTSYAAITFTLDFFLLVLNLYAILCVTSQYQEYRAGRGTARDEEVLSPPVIRYTRQSTCHSGLETNRRTGVHEAGVSVSINGIHTNQQDAGGRPGSFLLPPSSSPTRVDIKKHVQFPTHTQAKETEQRQEENKNKEQEEEEQKEEEKQEEEEEEKKKEEKQEMEGKEEKTENKISSSSSSFPLPSSSSSFPPPSSSSSPSSSSPPSPPQIYPQDAPLLKITRY